MAGLVSRARVATQLARSIVGAHLRSIVPVGITVVVGIVVLALLSGAYAQLIGVVAYERIVASVNSIESLTVAVVLVMTPLVLLALLTSLVWAGVASHAANAAFDRRRVSMPRAAGIAFRRSLRALAVLLVTLGAALGAILVAPLLVVAGVVGLLVTSGTRSSRFAGRWPSRRALIAMAIPFGVAALVLVRWSLALPAVWLDGLRMRAALAESSARVRGRGPEVAVLVIVALVASFGLSELAVGAIGTLGGGMYVELAARIVALILLGALPFTALTVLYRDGAADERPERLPAPAANRTRVAATLVVALTLPLAVVAAPGSAAQAAADSVVVLEADSTESIAGEQVILTATVSGGDAQDGTMSFQAIPDGGAPVDLGSKLVDGSHFAHLFTTDLPAGELDLVAHYSGDANTPATTSAPLAFTVHQATPSIDVSSSTPTSGDTTTLTITFGAVAPGSGTPSGTVTVSAGANALGTPTINGSGVATLAIDVAAAGTRELTVAYPGDSRFAARTVTYSVPKIATTVHVFTPSERNIVHYYGDSQTYEGAVATNTGTVPTGTVQLVWGGDVVAEDVLEDGEFSITTDELREGDDKIWLYYPGDASHASGDNDTADHRIDLEVKKATSVPVISIDPIEPGIGGEVTVTATLDDLGAGPTGTITFRDTSGTFYGTYPVADATASVEILVTKPTTFLTAEYSGSINFTAQTSAAFRMDATRAAVDVAIEDPGTVEYGEVFDLVATVSVAGGALTPDHGVDFATDGGPNFATNVPVIAGKATVEVCAGIAADCPVGTPALGADELDIVARYAESSTNLLGESAPYEYAAGKATTTTTLIVNTPPMATPVTILLGSAVLLEATVAAPSSGATPTGLVSFYGVMPVDGGGTSLAFLGNAPLVDGVARFTANSGTGTEQLSWPAEAIRAIYYADGAMFRASSNDVAVTVLRYGVTLGVSATPAAAGSPTPITVNLSHEPGTSADYTGKVTVTADTGQTCEVWVPAGQNLITCSITWAAVGAHSVTASYSGDLVYLPATSASLPVNIGKPTPSLGATVASAVIAETDVTVTWNQFSPTATGTITVWGDGTLWCDAIDVQALSCTGQFGAASATGEFVDVVVRYSGDANWNPLELVRKTKVSRCATLDVRSNNVALGTVTVDTPATCSGGRYLAGTTVTVTAHPMAGSEFVNWKKSGGSGLVFASASPTTSFLVTNDATTWVHIATFQTQCYTVTGQATGFGTIVSFPTPDCTTLGGKAGYSRGTKVTVYPDPLVNPKYGEKDSFYRFGELPPGVKLGKDSSNRPLLTFAISADVVVPVDFGPRCRLVTVVADPVAEGDHSRVVTPANCRSPQGDGFLPGSSVQVASSVDVPSRVLASWAVDGVVDTALGREAEPTVIVQWDDLDVTANYVDCYTVAVDLGSPQDARGREVGQVTFDVAANCLDGSQRYLSGTALVLTPEALVEGTRFTGWDDIPMSQSAIVPVGPITASARSLIVAADTEFSAGFFFPDTCSRFLVLGNRDLLDFGLTECGPGQYFDAQKQAAIRSGEPPSQLWQDKNRTVLTATVDPEVPLDVYVRVKGDTRHCFGDPSAFSGPSPDIGEWKTYGPLARPSSDCRIGGPIDVQVQACQTVVATPQITVAGDASGRTYGAGSIPGTLYLPGPDGVIGGFTMDGFDWVQGVPIYVGPDGTIRQEELAAGPCKDAGDAFPADTDLVLIAAGPSTGFAFDGFVDAGKVVPTNPIRTKTTATARTLPVTTTYTVTCHTVLLGEGVSIVGDAPRCPGSSESDNSYIAGTALQVKAVQNLPGRRILEKFTSGVVNSQIYEDPETLELTAFAYVDGDKTVAAYYPTGSERTRNGVLQGLKFTTGIFAVAAPIFVGMLFPPAGIFFAVMGAGAGIAALIPGGDKVAAVFDLVNPTKISTCIARWSFNKAGDPTGGANVGSLISTANTVRKVINGVEVLIEPVGPIGATGGLASFGYGLYDAGIGDANWSPQTVDDLADQANLESCLDDQWRAAG